MNPKQSTDHFAEPANGLRYKPAVSEPVEFKENNVRTKDRKDFFEREVAAEKVFSQGVLRLLNYSAYFDLLGQPLPDDHAAILNALAEGEIIRRCDADGWDITNLGAILLARKMGDFPTVQHKSVRIIKYKGEGRIEVEQDIICEDGYASGFEKMMKLIMALVPTPETNKGSRNAKIVFPEQVIREMVANALVHQDLYSGDLRTTVEIFDSRMEVVSPGKPLVDPQRFVDAALPAYNAPMASLMWRFRICRGHGSGIDRVLHEIEWHQLPAPFFGEHLGFTRAVLFARKSLRAMKRDDRVRTCYLHVCLRWVSQVPATKASIRERFGVGSRTADRYISETTEDGLIKPASGGGGASKRKMKYKPFWA